MVGIQRVIIDANAQVPPHWKDDCADAQHMMEHHGINVQFL